MAPLTRRAFLAQTASATLSAAAGTAKPAPRLRIGQIGTGHAHAAGKWATIRQAPEFEVVGLVENDPARRARAEHAEAWAGAPWMTEEELLQQPDLRVVCVETEVKDLLSTAARCLAASKSIHLDKPAGESLPAFRALRLDAEKCGLIVQMGYMFRYHPAFVLARRLVAEGALGEIFSLEAAMSKKVSAGERAGLRAYRGGGMFELGGHLLDPLVQLLGPPNKVTATARSLGGDGYADNQTALLEYPRALATLHVSMVEPAGELRRQFTVCGTRGVCEIRPLEPAAVRLTLEAPHGEFVKGPQDVNLPRSTSRYGGDFTDLAAVLRGEHPFVWSAAHDLAVQEALLRASGLPVEESR